jgi:hypothetical protein
MSHDRFLDALLARSMSHAEIRNVNASLLHAFEIKKDEIAFLLLVIIFFFFMLRMVFLNVALVFQVHDLATNVTSFLSCTDVSFSVVGTYTLSTSRAPFQELTSTFLL